MYNKVKSLIIAIRTTQDQIEFETNEHRLKALKTRPNVRYINQLKDKLLYQISKLGHCLEGKYCVVEYSMDNVVSEVAFRKVYLGTKEEVKAYLELAQQVNPNMTIHSINEYNTELIKTIKKPNEQA